jgi:broad specificity phosphatase PhoE
MSSENIIWQIPPAVPRWLNRIPTDTPVAMLIRHSVRPYLAPYDAGLALPLTEDGVRLAKELGALLKGRLRALHASPILRCIQTASAIGAGAGVDLDVEKSRLLGDPGIYVLDGAKALVNWHERQHEGVMDYLVRESDPLPGMAAPGVAARFLVHHMLAAAGSAIGYHVFVTHDSIVTATAGRLLEEPLTRDSWPWYLQAAFFWREEGRLHVAYRNFHGVRDGGPLCSLEEVDVLELARREIAATVGLDMSARFFLAGGAFKTLLTGHPPKDLDLWAPSSRDRDAVISALLSRGARRIEGRKFSDAFEIGERIVDVARKTEPAILEERLARFDLGLSAVGVEHIPGGRWRTFIHPRARLSVEKRQVLLMKPLVNWKFALTTLERARRYARELGFALPAEEIDEIWRVFDSQPKEVRQKMIDNFDLTGVGGFQAREEALCRLQ